MCHGFLQKPLSDLAGASRSSHVGRKPPGTGGSHFISTTKFFIRGKCLKTAPTPQDHRPPLNPPLVFPGNPVLREGHPGLFYLQQEKE